MANPDINPETSYLIQSTYDAIPPSSLSLIHKGTQSKDVKIIDADLAFLGKVGQIVCDVGASVGFAWVKDTYLFILEDLRHSGAEPYFFSAAVSKKEPSIQIVAPLGYPYIEATNGAVNFDLRTLCPASLSRYEHPKMVFSSQEPLLDTHRLCEAVRSLTDDATKWNMSMSSEASTEIQSKG